MNQLFKPRWQQQLLGHGVQRRRRDRRLCLSESRTILIAFHQSAYPNFKWFYTQLVCRYWRRVFPALVTYNRFVEWIPSLSYPYAAICVSALVSVRDSVYS
jgi:hypothetical protein